MTRMLSVALAAALLSAATLPAAHAADPLRLLATVAHMQAESAAEDLSSIAQEQSANNVRSQSQKRRDDHRRDLVRNWGG